VSTFVSLVLSFFADSFSSLDGPFSIFANPTRESMIVGAVRVAPFLSLSH